MRDFIEVIDFSIDELVLQQDLYTNLMNSDNFNTQPEDINKSQTIKDLDFLLDSPSVKNLKKLLSQKKYLLEKDKLH